MLPLRIQFAVTLLLGLLLGFALETSTPAVSAPLAPSVPTVAAPMPFVTRSDVLMVTMLVRREGPPEIRAVAPLDSGRLTAAVPGDSALEIQDASGNALYRVTFQPSFIGGGEPPRRVDELTLIFVVPRVPGAARIVLTTPGGTAIAEVAP